MCVRTLVWFVVVVVVVAVVVSLDSRCCSVVSVGVLVCRLKLCLIRFKSQPHFT